MSQLSELGSESLLIFGMLRHKSGLPERACSTSTDPLVRAIGPSIIAVRDVLLIWLMFGLHDA